MVEPKIDVGIIVICPLCNEEIKFRIVTYPDGTVGTIQLEDGSNLPQIQIKLR